MSQTNPFSVGVLAAPFCYEWQVRAIERLQSREGLSVPLVVYDDTDTDVKAESWNQKERIRMDDVRQFLEILVEEKAWSLVLAERNLGRIFGDDKLSYRRHSTESAACFDDTELLPCEPQTDDGWTEFPDDIVSRLEAECDVVVRFGFGLIRGDVLDAPEYGVVSFHPADIRKYRGMGPPPIFRDGRNVAGSTLQRLDESIDGGEIVVYDEVSISDCYTLWDVFDRLLTLQIYLLTEGIENLRHPDFDPITVPDDQLGELYYRSQRRSIGFSSRVLLKNLSGRFRRKIRSDPTTGDTLQHPPRPSE